jgi:hypothetical protein
MRNLVFTAIFAILLAAPSARADQLSMTTACLAPGACFVINTSACGGIMTVDPYGNVRLMGPGDPQLVSSYPGISGACGIYAPSYYAGVPREQIPQAHCTGANCGVNLHDLQ